MLIEEGGFCEWYEIDDGKQRKSCQVCQGD